MAVAHWVAANRRAAVGLFTRHAAFTDVLWHEAFQRAGWLEDSERPRTAVGPAKRRELVKAFGKYGTGPWVGMNLPKLIEAIQDQWADGGVELRLFHDISHRHSNQILHSTVTASGAAASSASVDSIGFWIGPTAQFIARALYAAYWVYGQLFTLLIDVFGIATRAGYNAVYRAGEPAFSSATADG